MLPNRRVVAFLLFVVLTPALVAQGPRRELTPEQAQRRRDTEKELESIAIIDRKVMVRMRDGKLMAADVYRPKDASKKYPIIFVRTPYNFNYWDVQNGLPRDLTTELTAIKRGYAFVEMNERGHFYSEGNYDILGPPRTDGFDAIQWLSSQPWSNGKVGCKAAPPRRSGRWAWHPCRLPDSPPSIRRDLVPASAA